MSIENRNKKTKKTGKIISTLLILLLVGVAAFFFIRYRQQQMAMETLNNLDLVPYSKETLVSSISGTGTVRSNQEAVLFWETSGKVGQVLVQVGDEVKTDALLMELDQTDLPLDIIQAKMEKLNAEQALEDFENNVTLQKAQLEADISLGLLTLQRLEDELELLEKRSCVSWRIDDLQADYDNALVTYEDWPTEVNLAKVERAKSALDFCEPEAISEQLLEKRSQVALQRESVRVLQLKQVPDPTDKEKLELQLESANRRLAALQLKAPFSGTITSIATRQGDLISAGTQALQLADLSRLLVETPVSEVDIPSVAVGQPAKLVFDAFFEQTFTGMVVEVAQVGVSLQGVINYTVTIEMENGLEVIKPGMTAGVSILVEEKPDVFTVPSEAITTNQGKEVVYVLRDGKPEMVEVKVGAYSDRKVEILEAAIDEGESIIVNPPTSILDAVPSGRFFR